MDFNSPEYSLLHAYFTHWAMEANVMDSNGMIWSQCYPEPEPLNEGDDDGSYDWGGTYYGGCTFHNDGDW